MEIDRRGSLRSRTGCDVTLDPQTLCLDSLFVAHPLLEGADGIALDRAGNIWVAANERNAIVVVSRKGRVKEVFHNAADPVTLRRSGGPLEFPTSPFLLGYPGKPLDRVTSRALRRIADAPVREEVRVRKAGSLFVYEDPALEALGPVEKQFLRMGPRNTQLLKDQARQIASALGMSLQQTPALVGSR